MTEQNDCVDNIKKIVELEVNVRHLTNDLNACFEKIRDCEKKIDDMEKVIDKKSDSKDVYDLQKEIARYKWIALGIAGALSFAVALVQSVASSLNVTLIDLFQKK